MLTVDYARSLLDCCVILFDNSDIGSDVGPELLALVAIFHEESSCNCEM